MSSTQPTEVVSADVQSSETQSLQNPSSDIQLSETQPVQSIKSVARCKGIISNFIHHRNFGFITSTEQQKNHPDREIFFHKTAIIKSNFCPKVRQGDKCYYEISKGSKGIIAINIVVYYRPNPKVKPEHTRKQKEENKTNLKMTLFTNTMLKLFEETTRSKKQN